MFVLTLLVLAPMATSLRATPPRLSIATSAAPLSSPSGLGRRGWAKCTASALGLAAAVGAPRSVAAFAKEADQGALKSLERQVELKRRPQPLLTRKKMEQVSRTRSQLAKILLTTLSQVKVLCCQSARRVAIFGLEVVTRYASSIALRHCELR